MNRSVTMAILTAAALLVGEWAWASPNLWAQQDTGPAGQGMMTGQASQGGAAGRLGQRRRAFLKAGSRRYRPYGR